MGVRERLRRAALRSLRGWIHSAEECELSIAWSFSGLELHLGACELISEALNALLSSPIIVRRASIASMKLTFSLIKSPAIALVVDALNVDLCARDAEDPYWKNAAAAGADRDRLKKLASIDPEGSYEHARAKLKEDKHQSGGFFLVLLISFLLSAVRVEIHDVKIAVQSRHGAEACVSAMQLVIGDDAPSSFYKGSFLGAFGNTLMYRGKISEKACKASQLSLTFVEQRRAQEQVISDDAAAVLMPMVWFSFGFCEEKFSGLTISIPEAIGGLESREVDIVMMLVDGLEGPSVRHTSGSSRTELSSTGRRNAKALWVCAVSKILSVFPRRRLSESFKAGILRRRYCNLYGDWLQNVGWNRTPRRFERTDSYANSIADLEKKLPVEALALARRIARKRVLLEISREADQGVREGDVSWSFVTRKWTSLLRAMGYDRDAMQKRWEEQLEDGRLNQTFSVNVVRGSLVFRECSGSGSVCLRWKKMSMGYHSKKDRLEKSFVLGSLIGEIVSSSGSVSVKASDEARTEARSRWRENSSGSFLFFSSSPFNPPERVTSALRDYDADLQERHMFRREKEWLNWQANAWKYYSDDKKIQKSLDNLQVPFLIVSYETASGSTTDEQHQGSAVTLTLGKIDIFMQSAMFAQLLPVVAQLQKITKAEERSSPNDLNKPISSTSNVYKRQMDKCGSVFFSYIPETRLQIIAVIENVRVTLYILEKELQLHVKSMKSLAFDLGYMEISLWPAKKWIKPPRIQEELCTLKDGVEHDNFRSNLLVFVEGCKLYTPLENFIGPLAITLESSFQRKSCSSFFETLKCLSVATALRIPSVSICLDTSKVTAAMQVLLYYVDAVTNIYVSTSEETAESGADSVTTAANEIFLVDISLNLGDVKMYLNDAQSKRQASSIDVKTGALLVVNSILLDCAVGNCSPAGICFKLQDVEISLVPTNINFEQVLERRLVSARKVFFMDHFIITFDGSEVGDDNFWWTTKVDAGPVFIASCPTESIVSKARVYPSTAEDMHVVIVYDQKLSVEVEAGLTIFETTATTELINFIINYMENFSMRLDLVMSHVSKKSTTAQTQTGLDRSHSFPEEKKLVVVPARSHSTPELLQGNEGSSMEGSMSFKISGLTVVLSASGERDVEALLLVLTALTDVVSERGSCKIKAEIKQFTIISLRSELNRRLNDRAQGRVPQFGFNGNNETFESNEKLHNDISSASQRNTSIAGASDMNCLLESLTVSSTLSRQNRKGVDLKWANAWSGQISVTGLDVAATTYELQMLVAIVTPLTLISFSKGSSESICKRGGEAIEKVVRHRILDGSIVALKDAQEHLYLSVEDNSLSKDQFHLGGAWHYSVAGERALFKVEYHEKDKDSPWFSLVSLYAKTSTGVPLRVHYQPGSRQLEISSTNDSPWELWQCIPYRSNDDEINVYSGVFGHLVHLINQKSKQGIALADGIPVVASYPGNAFKIEVVTEPHVFHSQSTEVQENLTAKAAIASATGIPEVRFDMGSICITLLHEAAGAVHLLPLIRVRLDEVQGLAQASSQKARVIGGFSFVTEHYEAQSSSWLSIVNPVMLEVIGSLRLERNERKFPVSLFCRLKKVEVLLSELSLDACLFLIGVMDLAGPYTVKYSPVLVNRCQVENQTGLNVLIRFDRESGGQEEGKVDAWQTTSFLMRHVRSRRGTTPAEVSSSVAVSLEKPGTGLSSALIISLAEPGVFAGRTRLEALQGSRSNAPGPIVVVDVSKQSQDGIFLTVSPMVKIHNATGLALQLRCRRPKQGDGGAIVSLKDGDIIDDSMGAFDALNLEGEMKKALLSFNVGNFLLSIRPDDNENGTTYDWSEDVKGAKAVRVSGLFDKLHYSFQKTLKSKSLESSFGSVVCKATTGDSERSRPTALHFLIRTFKRQVPVTRLSGDRQQKRSIIAWQEQQELLLLPTLKVFNFLSSGVNVRIASSTSTKDDDNGTEVAIAGTGGKSLLYADLSALFLVIKVQDHDFVSDPVDISTGHKRFQELTKKGGSVKDIEMEVAFKDGAHVAMLKVYRAEDGVLELVLFSKYMLQNDSQIPILCCTAKPPSRWQGRRVQNLQWPPSAPVTYLLPGSRVSWFSRSNTLLLKRQEEGSQPSWLDLNSLSGSSELSLAVRTEHLLDKIQLGLRVQVPSKWEPSHIVRLAARYTVANESPQSIIVCQNRLEEDETRHVVIEPMHNAAVHAQEMDGSDKHEKVLDCSTLSLRFQLKDVGGRWSGRVYAASLGSFFLKLRDTKADGSEEKNWSFAVVNVEEEESSLIIRFRLHSREAVPYRIENRLRTGSMTFHQKDTVEPDTLPAMTSTDYVWDDLSLPHRLVVIVTGTQACSEINLDKVKGWKSFAASHRSKGFSLQLPFQGNGDQTDDLLDMGYEVYADGPTRVLRVCQKVDSTKKSYWETEMSIPQGKVELKMPIFKIIMLETSKQRIEDLTAEELSGSSPFSQFLCVILASSSIETFITSDHAICQLKVQSFGADMKWQGAPFAAMLRVHDQDRLSSTTTALHAAFVLSNLVANPIQAKYASVLIQAFDLNVDEDTLMKLVPFYRTSLSTTSSSWQIYFERFEIHPIKIVASFVPGHPRADYTSTQETFRALLHTVIKLPSVRGATVELNGVLLSHALLTFKQLAMKCFQHYSWYAMRAIYIARGSKLLPPGFSSLFDDSAASSLDVFFDPSSGSIDLQGLTLGMFNLLSRGLRKREGGTSRYLGDLENTVKKAGSNLVFAVVTEISDNVLKGAETNGFDGMVNGFRRGILNVAMEPLALQKAVVKGGSSRRIQLDRSVGTDEAYIEGYLQAMLDALFKQDYLKVKVMEDQVILKNLPPNSMLMNEIVACVKNFLISEGLLAGEASIAAVRSMRLLRGESERKVVPAVISLSEQLLVIFAIRGLRQYTKKLLHLPGGSEKAAPEPSEIATKEPPPQLPRPNFRRTIGNFFISSAVAYIDGRLCRHIPNELARRIVSGFLLSFVE